MQKKKKVDLIHDVFHYLMLLRRSASLIYFMKTIKLIKVDRWI